MALANLAPGGNEAMDLRKCYENGTKLRLSWPRRRDLMMEIIGLVGCMVETQGRLGHASEGEKATGYLGTSAHSMQR